MDDIPVRDVVRFREELREYIRTVRPEIASAIIEQKTLTDDIKKQLDEALTSFKAQFRASSEN